MKTAIRSVVTTGLALLGLCGHALGAAPVVVNPLKSERAVGIARGAAALSVDAQAYRALKGVDRAVFPQVTLDPVRGVKADLELQRFEVFTHDARIVEMTDAGEVELPRPDVQLWRGTVRGDADSKVFLAITPESAQGYIATAAETFVVSAGDAGAMPTLVFGANSEAAKNVDIGPGEPCMAGLLPPIGPLPERPNTGASERGSNYTCKRFRIAIETDNELRNRFTSSAQATTYVTTLMGAVSEIYQRDVKMVLTVPFLRIWTTTDPWNAANTGAQLDQFVSYWGQNMNNVQRDLAHFLSTRPLGGGIAYINAACSGFGYGVSANLNGGFPYPLVNNSASNWDPNVVAHELGHNFGTGHTHESNWYNPIVDGCGLAYVGGVQDCSVAFAGNGSIMSYCHLCSGGMANIKLDFGPRVEDTIRGFIDSGAAFCAVNLPARLTNPAGQNVNEGDPITLSAAFETIGAINYQWRRNGNNLTPGGRFSGVNSPTLTINPSVAGDAGQYDCVVSGDCGAGSSLSATVAVNAYCPSGNRPTITQQPQASEAIEGTPLQISLTASGPIAGYQWFRGPTALTNTGNVSGANSPTLTLSPLLASDAGSYYCKVIGTQCDSLSVQVVVTVVPPPPGSFELLSPANGATSIPIAGTLLDWSDSSNALLYRLLLDNNADFSSPIVDVETPGSAVGITAGTLQQGVTYYWTVTATNDFGTTQPAQAVFSFSTFAPPTPCDTDWTNDGRVDTVDLAVLLGRFGQTPGPSGQGDANGDGIVNTADLVALLGEFGRTDCP